MVAAPLSDRAVLPYLIANTALLSLAMAVPPDRPTGWDAVMGLASAAVVVLGTLWVFRQNGADRGAHFLGRFTALSWVIGTRLLPAFLFVFIVVGDAEAQIVTEWHDVLITLGFCVVYYHRLGVHVRDVAVRAASRPAETNT